MGLNTVVAATTPTTAGTSAAQQLVCTRGLHSKRRRIKVANSECWGRKWDNGAMFTATVAGRGACRCALGPLRGLSLYRAWYC